jgi:hypothetical protein
MAPTPLYNTGWEHQVISSSGGGIFLTVAGTPTIDTTVFNNGLASMKVAMPAALSGPHHVGCRTIAAQTRPATRFYFRKTGNPSVAARIAEIPLVTSAAFAKVVLGTAGSLTIIWDVGTGSAAVSSSATAVLNDNQFYCVDLVVDGNSASYVARLWLDETAVATDATMTAAGAAAAVTARVGVTQAITLGTARDFNWDDWIVGTASSISDKFGKGKGIMINPGSDGTHNTAGGATFIDGDTATTPNFTNSTTTAYTFVDDATFSTTRSTTDNISAETHVAGDYMEIKPRTDQALAGETAQAVTALLSYSSVTATANAGSATVIRTDGATETEIFGNFTTGVDMSEITNFFKGAIVTVDGGQTWTETEIEALRWRIGRASNSSDVSPRPTWQTLMLELDYPILAAATISLIYLSPTTSTIYIR